MSGYAADMMSADGLVGRYVDSIQKPFSAGALAAKVAEMPTAKAWQSREVPA